MQHPSREYNMPFENSRNTLSLTEHFAIFNADTFPFVFSRRFLLVGVGLACK